MTRTQKKALDTRLAYLKIELEDDICRKYPTAAAHVQAEIDRVRAALGAAAGAARIAKVRAVLEAQS